MSNKAGPFKKLKEGQEDMVNKFFYDGYQKNYFNYKIILFANFYNNIDLYINSFSNTDINIERSKIKCSKVDNNEFLNFIKTDFLESYYHCLETFIRLFIVHAKFSDCPPMYLVDIETKKVRKWMEKFSRGIFEGLNDQYSVDDTICRVFYGCNKNKSISKQNIANIKEWIVNVSKYLLDSSEYNTFKHGCSVFSQKRSIKIDEIYGEKVNINICDDTMKFFEKYEDLEQYKFGFRENHIKYDKTIIVMSCISEAIKRILSIAEDKYVYNNKMNLPLDTLYIADNSYNEIIDNLKRNNEKYIVDNSKFFLFYEEQ